MRTGKTHTMQGTAKQPGIIPRAVEHVVNLAKRYQKADSDCTICVSYLEIYNEKVYDLLSPSDNDLPIREDQSRAIFVSHLSKTKISTAEEFRQTYEAGCKNLSTAATKLNASSSRSHAIVTLRIIQRSVST